MQKIKESFLRWECQECNTRIPQAIIFEGKYVCYHCYKKERGGQ